ncbi:hypothetical protein [uncultured Acinetobacter sp.]|nr:hypothetical protein [uncultured Acinetobacter sp.]
MEARTTAHFTACRFILNESSTRADVHAVLDTNSSKKWRDMD